MAEARGYGEADEDRLPWLEPVDEEPVDDGVSAGRLVVALVVALIAIGLVVGGVYWLKQRASGGETASGDATLIPTPAEPYKARPAQPGGMQVKGQGDASYAASEGADVNGQIDLSAVPETPVARAPKAPPAMPASQPTPAKPAATPAPAPAQVAKAPAPAAAAPARPAAGGSQVQLGAFSSEAKANAAWKALSGRFATLAPLAHSVEPGEVGGKTVYRLRAAAGGQAQAICAKLKVAGGTCLVVG